jgi:hypothetical protein
VFGSKVLVLVLVCYKLTLTPPSKHDQSFKKTKIKILKSIIKTNFGKMKTKVLKTIIELNMFRFSLFSPPN